MPLLCKLRMIEIAKCFGPRMLTANKHANGSKTLPETQAFQEHCISNVCFENKEGDCTY